MHADDLGEEEFSSGLLETSHRQPFQKLYVGFDIFLGKRLLGAVILRHTINHNLGKSPKSNPHR